MRSNSRSSIVVVAVAAMALGACLNDGGGQFGGGPTAPSAARPPSGAPAAVGATGAVGSAAGPVAPGGTPPPPPAPGTSIRANATGFFVTFDGYAVTNDHVVSGERRLFALIGGKELPIRVIERDEQNDLALIKVATASRPIPIAAAPPPRAKK